MLAPAGFVPGLAERWTSSNRLSVALAEQKQQDALGEANAYRDQMRSLLGLRRMASAATFIVGETPIR